MSIHHIPAHRAGEDPEIAEIIAHESVLSIDAEVPLVMWVDGKRHVIGTATVRGGEVSTMLNDTPLAEEIMDAIAGRPNESHFSIGWTRPPFRYGEPKRYEF